jgi:hypothetical protein
MSSDTTFPDLPPTIFDRAVDRAKATVQGWRRSRAKSKLEVELARIIETANAHQAKGLPVGAPAYHALLAQARGKIQAFATKHQENAFDIEQEVPALRDLERLTQAPSVTTQLSKGVGLVLLVIVAAIVIGMTSGLIATGYRWVVTLL